MLRRYDDEKTAAPSQLDVMHTCIADAVVIDVRYQIAMRWFRSLEAMKPGDESSCGVLSCARKRSAALARAWEAESR